MVPEVTIVETGRWDNGGDRSCRLMSLVGTVVSRRRREVEVRYVAVNSSASSALVDIENEKLSAQGHCCNSSARDA